MFVVGMLVLMLRIPEQNLSDPIPDIVPVKVVRYIYERLTTLAPTNEESAWLNEEKNLIGKKMISCMSASDVSCVVSLVY